MRQQTVGDGTVSEKKPGYRKEEVPNGSPTYLMDSPIRPYTLQTICQLPSEAWFNYLRQHAATPRPETSNS